MPEQTRKIILFTAVFALLCPSTLVSSPPVPGYRFYENGEPLARGADIGFLPDTPTRKKIDLSGTWTYSVDGGPSGKVRVPSAFDFPGKVTFERAVTMEPRDLDRHRWHIVLLGVEFSCEVYVNGEFVGTSPGGYSSAIFPVPSPVLQPGPGNTVRIILSGELDPRATVPLRQLPGGWKTYGGITRDIFFLGTPSAYFRDVVVRSEVSENRQTARLRVMAAFDGSWDPLPLQGSRPDAPAMIVEVVDRLYDLPVAKTGPVAVPLNGGVWDTCLAEVVVPSPKFWSPSTPDMYMVRCQLVHSSGELVDEYVVNTGIRSLAIRGGDFVLNGSRVVLKGVTWYEDHPLWGSALTLEQRERDIVQIRALGANAVRFMHHAPHPYMLNLCDRYGLLALVELPVYRAPAEVLAAEEYRELASGILRRMIVRDRNHPSLLAWGLAAESAGSGEGPRSFVRSLVATARTLDRRPLYTPLRPGTPDSILDLTDITALDMGAVEGQELAELIDHWRKAGHGRPVMITTLGVEVQEENRRGYNDPLSQQAQARFFLQRLETARTSDADGVFVWSFQDRSQPRASLVVHSGDPMVETRGLVNARREKRLAFDAVRSVYQGERFVALPAGTAPSRGPITFVLAGFAVLIGGVYFYNANRRFRECLLRSVMSSFNFFADIRDQRLVSLVHTTILGLLVSVSTAIVFASILLHFRENEFLDAALSILLVSDTVKEALVRLVWDPVECILVLSGVLMFALVLVSLVLLAVRLALKSRLSLYHAYAVTVWSTPPLLALIPVGMILFRVIESSVYVTPSLIIVGVLHVWVLLRFLKGLAIVSESRPYRVYLLTFLLCAAGTGILWAYYDITHAAPMHLSYLFDLLAQAN